MDHIPFPAQTLAASLTALDQQQLDKVHFQRLGVVVLRRAVPQPVITDWIVAWKEFHSGLLASGRQVDPYNPVVVHENVPEVLASIHAHPVLLDLMQQLYPNLALFVQRFVIKDRESRQPVFLHQDYCYDLGFPDKTSVFLPLGPMSPENGGLQFYPGTHLLGYLGDAGELNREMLDPDWPVVAPTLAPGDLVLMHECTWHASSPHISGADRIVVQITYQPASDPSGIRLLRGTAEWGLPLGSIDRNRLFNRSRTSRIKELQQMVNHDGGR